MVDPKTRIFHRHITRKLRDREPGLFNALEIFDHAGMESILREAEEPYRTLYALLAGCGPMRAGEARGLDIKSIRPDFRTLDIVQKAKRGELQDYMKTKNADTKHGRVVDLPAKLAAVRHFVGTRRAV